MRDYLLKKWIDFRHCDDGVTLVEYGIAVVSRRSASESAL